MSTASRTWGWDAVPTARPPVNFGNSSILLHTNNTCTPGLTLIWYLCLAWSRPLDGEQSVKQYEKLPEMQTQTSRVEASKYHNSSNYWGYIDAVSNSSSFPDRKQCALLRSSNKFASFSANRRLVLYTIINNCVQIHDVLLIHYFTSSNENKRQIFSRAKKRVVSRWSRREISDLWIRQWQTNKRNKLARTRLSKGGCNTIPWRFNYPNSNQKAGKRVWVKISGMNRLIVTDVRVTTDSIKWLLAPTLLKPSSLMTSLICYMDVETRAWKTAANL